MLMLLSSSEWSLKGFGNRQPKHNRQENRVNSTMAGIHGEWESVLEKDVSSLDSNVMPSLDQINIECEVSVEDFVICFVLQEKEID